MTRIFLKITSNHVKKRLQTFWRWFLSPFFLKLVTFYIFGNVSSSLPLVWPHFRQYFSSKITCIWWGSALPKLILEDYGIFWRFAASFGSNLPQIWQHLPICMPWIFIFRQITHLKMVKESAKSLLLGAFKMVSFWASKIAKFCFTQNMSGRIILNLPHNYSKIAVIDFLRSAKKISWKLKRASWFHVIFAKNKVTVSFCHRVEISSV